MCSVSSLSGEILLKKNDICSNKNVQNCMYNVQTMNMYVYVLYVTLTLYVYVESYILEKLFLCSAG